MTLPLINDYYLYFAEFTLNNYLFFIFFIVLANLLVLIIGIIMIRLSLSLSLEGYEDNSVKY